MTVKQLIEFLETLEPELIVGTRIPATRDNPDGIATPNGKFSKKREALFIWDKNLYEEVEWVCLDTRIYGMKEYEYE